MPKALTRPAGGAPFIQAGNGTRPHKRWSSWYDHRLVTADGEHILELLDTWAIKELRRHQLVWSGWGDEQTLGLKHDPIPGTPWGIRSVEGLDGSRLRLFFLSLLWRAAASDRIEFSEVALPESDLERLRLMVLSGHPEPLEFYPTILSQLSTRGPVHNQTPIRSLKSLPAVGEQPETPIPSYRFYFDGLAAHMHIDVPSEQSVKALGPLVVGCEKRLVIHTVTYEQSFQRQNLERVHAEARSSWPSEMKKLAGS